MKNPTNLTASEISTLSGILAMKVVSNEEHIAAYPDSDINKWLAKDIDTFTSILEKMDTTNMIDICRTQKGA